MIAIADLCKRWIQHTEPEEMAFRSARPVCEYSIRVFRLCKPPCWPPSLGSAGTIHISNGSKMKYNEAHVKKWQTKTRRRKLTSEQLRIWNEQIWFSERRVLHLALTMRSRRPYQVNHTSIQFWFLRQRNKHYGKERKWASATRAFSSTSTSETTRNSSKGRDTTST